MRKRKKEEVRGDAKLNSVRERRGEEKGENERRRRSDGGEGGERRGEEEERGKEDKNIRLRGHNSRLCECYDVKA